MTEINKKNVMEVELDLREGWEMVEDSAEAQRRILGGEKGPFYWYDESEEWIITLKDGMYLPYKVSETVITLPSESDKLKKKTGKKVLNVLKKYKLRLNTKYRVEDSAEAYRRAKAGEKGEYWFVSEDKTTIRVLDFTKGDKPKMSDYPVKETKILYDTVEM